MYSEEVKLVLGLDPSGLFEKVIVAPRIGTPRTLSARTGEGESDVEATGAELSGVAGVSFLTIFGTLIFGSVNCPIAGSASDKVSAITAMRINDDVLVIIWYFPLQDR